MIAVLTGATLLLQLSLVISGAATLIPENDPGTPIRLFRFASYFTIQSNLLVAVTFAWSALRPAAGSRLFTVVRIAAICAIVITGVVHFLLLRPLLDLHGANALADTLLHQVIPVLAVLVQLLLPPAVAPGRRFDPWVLVWPAGWLVATLVRGGLTDWFPYPFLNFRTSSVTAVAITSVLIAVTFTGLSMLIAVLWRRRVGDPGSIR